MAANPSAGHGQRALVVGVDGPAVLVHASVAAFIGPAVLADLRRRVRDGEVVPEAVLLTARALEEVGRAWRSSQPRRPPPAIADLGNGAAAGIGNCEMVAGIAMASTAEAAAVLGVKSRRVVQLASVLGGVKRGGRWWFEAGAVAALRDEREARA